MTKMNEAQKIALIEESALVKQEPCPYCGDLNNCENAECPSWYMDEEDTLFSE